MSRFKQLVEQYYVDSTYLPAKRLYEYTLNYEDMSEIIEKLLRIDKAIEYISNHKEQLHHGFDEPDFDYLLCANADELLDILQGDDKQ